MSGWIKPFRKNQRIIRSELHSYFVLLFFGFILILQMFCSVEAKKLNHSISIIWRKKEHTYWLYYPTSNTGPIATVSMQINRHLTHYSMQMASNQYAKMLHYNWNRWNYLIAVLFTVQKINNNNDCKREGKKHTNHSIISRIAIWNSARNGPTLHENLSFDQLMINVYMRRCFNRESKNINKMRLAIECSVIVFTIVLHA